MWFARLSIPPFLRWLLGVITIGYLGLLIVAYLHADRLIFAPHRAGYFPSPELITLANASDQRFMVYFLPPVKKDGKIVLFNHGYNSDIADLLPRVRDLRAQRSFGLVLYDYQGYGLSKGKPREESCYQDAVAVYDYLTKTLGYKKEQIIVYGHSLGTAIALELALRRPIDYLVLDSPFVSAFRVATRWKIIPWDRFDNLSKIGHLAKDCYLEIRYSKQDRKIGYWHSQKLYAASLLNGANAKKRALVERQGAHDAWNLDGLSMIGEKK